MTASLTPQWSIEQIQAIVDDQSHATVGNVEVDTFTAGIMLQVYDALSAKNRKRAVLLPVAAFASFAWRQTRPLDV